MHVMNRSSFDMLGAANCGLGMHGLIFETSNCTDLESTQVERTVFCMHNKILKTTVGFLEELCEHMNLTSVWINFPLSLGYCWATCKTGVLKVVIMKLCSQIHLCLTYHDKIFISAANE